MKTKDFIKYKNAWMDIHVWAEGCSCEKCGRIKNLTLDHIIPSILLLDMGYKEEELKNPELNWRVLCRICNNLKGMHIDFTDKRTARLLHNYLNAMEQPEELLKVDNSI